MAPAVLLDHVQVAVADAGRLDPHEHLAGLGRSTWISSSATLSARAEDYALRQPRPVELADRVAAGEREVEVDLGHQVLDQLLDPALPADRERVGVRAAEEHGVGAERHRLQHVGGRADAAVHQHDRVGQRVAHLDERVERGDGAVDLAAAVVRDDDAVDAVLRARAARRRRSARP